MLQKSSKKTVPLPSRPEQPSVSDIVRDIKNSTPDDVVFTFFKDDKHESNSPDSMYSDSTFSFGDQSKSSVGSPDAAASASGTDEIGGERESIYEKAVTFIQQTEALKTAPTKLEQDCIRLESLCKDLTETIDSLRDQAQTLLQKSTKNS